MITNRFSFGALEKINGIFPSGVLCQSILTVHSLAASSNKYIDKLEGHSVERIYLRQRCSHGSR